MLQCLDQSRKIAADRWFIRIVLRIGIPVEKKWFEENAAVDRVPFQKIRQCLGNDVVFEQVRERNFVSQEEKDAVSREICNRSVGIAATYCGRMDFPGRYILQCYHQKQAASFHHRSSDGTV
jgi:hypothetical protein